MRFVVAIPALAALAGCMQAPIQNNGAIAELIQDWLLRRGLYR